MKKFIQTVPGKVTLFLITILSLCLTSIGVLGAAVMISCNFYTHTQETISEEFMLGQMYDNIHDVTLNAIYRQPNELYEDPFDNSNLVYELTDSQGNVVARTIDASPDWTYHFQVEANTIEGYINRISRTEFSPQREPGYVIYTFQAYLREGFPVNDEFALIHHLVDFGYTVRYAIFALIGVSLLAAILSFVALMCASARRKDTEDLVPGPLHRLPLDLMILLLAAFAITGAYLVDWWYYDDLALILAVLVLCIILGGLTLGLCMSIAARIKTHTLFTNTVIWYTFCLLRKLGRKLLLGLRQLCSAGRQMFRRLPMIWRTLLLVCVISLAELIFFLMTYWEAEVLLIGWCLEKLVLIPVVLYIAFTLRTLQRGGIALAEGDLHYQTDTRKMFWDFKRHGENLNHIAEGMNRAVDQRLRSERMRTELITNVSHDIKTPLTSIINYADLIGKEPCENPRILEYSAVLLRQSDRMKRLIDDLVEASKASTGNLEVELVPCDADIFLSQISGEYEQKMAAANLTLITKQPEETVQVMADGRRMLRIFDNLMNNICKYAQPGTRVYLTLEAREGEAIITFRNISRCALDLSEEELMERFVRGDASRNTEGSGLGLSIARSLTELQHGRMELAIDGDLFKVILHFPLLGAEPMPGNFEDGQDSPGIPRRRGVSFPIQRQTKTSPFHKKESDESSIPDCIYLDGTRIPVRVEKKRTSLLDRIFHR